MSRNTNRIVSKSFEKVYRSKKAAAATVNMNRKYNFCSVKNSIDGYMLPGIKLKYKNKKDMCV